MTTISGYRQLSPEEIDLINEIKQKSSEVRDLIIRLESRCGNSVSNFVPFEQQPDYDWLKLGRQTLATGFMQLVRAVAKPTDGL